MAYLYVTTFERPAPLGGESLIHTTLESKEVIPVVSRQFPEKWNAVFALLQVDTPVSAMFETPGGGKLKFHIIDLGALPYV